MQRSLLLEGILAEDTEAARAQVWTFDHATVIGQIGKGIPHVANWASSKFPLLERLAGLVPASLSESEPSDPTRHARDDGFILPIGPADWKAAKLGRLLKHFDLHFSGPPTEAELLDLCLAAEDRAVSLLSRLAGPGQAKSETPAFQGKSIFDLAQYMLRRMFQEIDNSFAAKPEEEQERIAADIARLLQKLPPEVQERIRGESKLTDLSADALKKTGAIAAVGGALVGVVGIAGFAAYTTLTSVIAASAGLFGLTLPFAVYLHATAALAFLSHPLLLAGATLLGGRLALKRANRQIRDRLCPVMAATAVMAATTSETAATQAPEIVSLLAEYASLRHTSDYRLRAQIDHTFQCLPNSA